MAAYHPASRTVQQRLGLSSDNQQLNVIALADGCNRGAGMNAPLVAVVVLMVLTLQLLEQAL